MKTLLKYYLFLFLGGIISTANSQFITIEDTCVLNKLIQNHPTLLNASNQLDVTKAKANYGELNLSKSCVSDLSILQYFTNITSLQLSNNKIVTLNQVQNKGLAYVYLNNNFITDVSPLYALPKLYQLEVSNNKISTLETPVKHSSITWFYGGKNPITVVKSLDSLVNMKGLILTETQLTALPSVQNMKKLEELHINNTSIELIQGLDSLKNFKKLFAHFSKLKNINGLDSNTTLELLSIHTCNLTELPYLSNKDSLKSFTNLMNNNLSFSSFLKEKNTLIKFNVFLSPQKPFFVKSNDTLNEKDSISFIIPEEQKAVDNTYSWFRNDTLIQQTKLPYFTLSSLKNSDEGEYHVEITNSNFSNTTLSSQTWKLTINPCIEANNPEFAILSTDCKTGYSIEFSKQEIKSHNAPFSYSIKNVHNNNSSINGQPIFNQILAGNYSFVISDSKNCSLSFPFTLKPLADCKNVFTPNNDGFQDEFFISETGSTIILNKNGEEILKIQTPNSWNGCNKQGEIVQPGYYIIITNENIISGVNVVY